jgi:beta-lactamase class A
MTYSRDGNKLVRTGILLLILLSLGIGATRLFAAPRSTLSPIPEDPKAGIFDALFAKKKRPEDLKKAITGMVGTTWANYSVYVVDFDSDFAMGINETSLHTAASINKLPILAATYYLVQKGTVDLDRVITMQQDDIQDYGTGTMRYDEPGTTYSVKTLVNLMMQKSDNTAAYILGNHIDGMDTIQSLVTAWGMTQTDMEGNKTSNADMARLMRKIVEEKIANHALTLDMFSTMKDSDYEDRLPALLPKDVAVYHKIGTGTGAIHDVGVVIGPKTRYYIGVFASDVHDEAASVKLIAQISRSVYDFMK